MTTPKELTPAEAKAQILQMLVKNPFVSMATFGTDDWPDVRAMVVAATDGVDALWFATCPDSSKVAQTRKNPKATIYGYDLATMTEFRVFGSIELLDDAASRRKVWSDEFLEHWPDGVDSPNMIVMRFSTACGVYDRYGKEIGKF